ncbi:MAG: hypothetical protein J7L39_02435 [Candidatus Aenigmarchaeota archaeon]|nr:hypothetical protein [Candidatus Aenigmarchaeota archaeon]
MKGISPIVLLIVGCVGALVMFGIVMHFGIYQTSMLQRAFRESQLVESISMLFTVKEVLSQALTYSFYQAYYNTSVNGGFLNAEDIPKKDGIVFWRNFSDIYEPEILENIEVLSLKLFNEYKEKFSPPKGISVPPSEDLNIFLDFSNDKIYIKANSTKSISSLIKEPDEFVELKDVIVSWTKSSLPDLVSLFEKKLKKEIFENDRIKEIFENEEKKIKQENECNYIKLTYCENEKSQVSVSVPQECIDKFKENVRNSIEEWIKSKVLPNYNTISFDWKILELKTKVKYKLIEENLIEENSRDCECEEEGDRVYTCEPGMENVEECWETVCKEYYDKYEVKYEFSYQGDATIIFEIKASEKLPVYDYSVNSNGFYRPYLKFMVRSGNLE